MLYIVSSPIGNLKDISFRALEVLKTVDFILCEDTRHSGILLKHYEITTPTRSFHKFNEAAREDGVLDALREGKDVAVLSDAGTPGIADPAARLVARAREEGVSVSSIPGACAAICALSCSGLSTDRFQFLGFAPRQDGALRQFLGQSFAYPGTSVFYESPQRLLNTLELLAQQSPQQRVCIARELTKHFEEVDTDSATVLWERWKGRSVKGEVVILVEGHAVKEDFEDLSAAAHVALVEKVYGVTRKEALKIAAEERGVPKRALYAELVQD